MLPFLDEFVHDGKVTPYVKDIPGLFRWFGLEFNPDDWRYFIDSNKDNTKCCLLPNVEELSDYYGDDFPVIPLLISSTLTETYENMEIVLQKTKYNDYKFLICCDLKLVNILCGMGPAQSKESCFLCNFVGSRSGYDDHYTSQYQPREPFVAGQKTTLDDRVSLVDQQRIIIPPLHVMMGLYSSFIKCVQNNEFLFEYLESALPCVSKAKHKEGVLTGGDIRKLIDDQTFYNFLNDQESYAWESFCLYTKEFLCSIERPENYVDLAKNLNESFGSLKHNMSLKVHLAVQHVDFFQISCARFTEQPGERFHQDYKKIIERFAAVGLGITSLADYLWLLKRESNDLGGRKDNRQSFPVSFF